MKLLGVEFRNYARFERQYIPLKTGLNLLVGKNNSGKTAVLKGLGAFSSAPVGQVTNGAIQYIREIAGTVTPSADLDVMFETEDTDPPIFAGIDESRWRELISSGKPKFVFRFKLWRNASLLSFEGIDFLMSGFVPIPYVTVGQQGSPTKNFHAFPKAPEDIPEIVSSVGFPVSGQVFSSPQGNRMSIDPTVEIVRPLTALRSPIFVSPHRQIPPAIQMRTEPTLTGAENLPAFLDTLNGESRSKFSRIEQTVLAHFPEFEYLNIPSEANQVFVAFDDRASGSRIRLQQCGTGVEQLLVLICTVMTAKSDNLLLLDEPHSFLHPSAERTFIDFLQEQSKNKVVVISTHSSAFINAVTPDRITYLEGPGNGYEPERVSASVGMVLSQLGYMNSDAVSFDRLIFVEGENDKRVLPILLRASGLPDLDIEKTGFPLLGGVPEDVDGQLAEIRQFEKLLLAVGRIRQPRAYLFDGDRKQIGERAKRMRLEENGGTVPVVYLRRTELENYLLVPSAISAAIEEEARLLGADVTVSSEFVSKVISEALDRWNQERFPIEAGTHPLASVKGSKLLELIYRQCLEPCFQQEPLRSTDCKTCHARECF